MIVKDMVVKVFSKKDCPKCEEAKIFAKDVSGAGMNVEMHDIDTVEGLAEAAMYSIMATPSVVLSNASGACLRKWKSTVPALQDLSF